MAAQWFCKIAGKEHGPLSAQQLVQLARARRLKPTDPVRKDKSAWVAASNVQGLFPKADVVSSVTTGPGAEATANWTKSPDATAKSAEEPDQGDGFSVLDGSDEGPKEAGPATQIIKELAPGSTLGNYLILETLGEGGMGVVLKAQHIRMDRMVALKVLRSQAMQSPTAVKRFQQEVRAAAKLSHPNIVTAYDADEVRGVHFLVMEYVNGCSLAELLASRKKLDVKEAIQFVLQTARGLEYSHGEGVVHRDIKPGNLLLDKRGTVKILDMGLASIKEVGDAPTQRAAEFVTQENQLLGTFDYMPPEQAEDARSVDHRADIYSLGCSLYRLLTGRPPYSGDNAIKKILAHRDNPIPSIRELRPDAPLHIDQVFRRMVAKRPEGRQQSMTEVITELEACLAGKFKPGPVDAFSGGLGDPGQFQVESGSTGSHGSTLRGGDKAIYIPSPKMTDSDDDMFALAPEQDERYFWQVMGQESGPYTRDQLRRKKISPDDLVRLENDDRWRRASDIPGLL